MRLLGGSASKTSPATTSKPIIGNALKAGDMKMVGAALKRMVVVDPERAVAVYADLKAAARIAGIINRPGEHP